MACEFILYFYYKVFRSFCKQIDIWHVKYFAISVTPISTALSHECHGAAADCETSDRSASMMYKWVPVAELLANEPSKQGTD
jgi:hypothetical protein